MTRIFWINFGYLCERSFASLEAAIEHAKKQCFEASFIAPNAEVVGSWSPIGGLRMM